MKQIFNTKTLLLLCLMLAPVCVFAYGGYPGGNHNHMDAPLDGGLSLLLVAGIGYGAKKYANKKKMADK